MRPVLTAVEYQQALQALSSDEIRQAAAAVASAAEAMMAKHGLERAVFLSGRPLQRIAIHAAELLAQQGKGASVALSDRDELPDLSEKLVCDLLFVPSMDETLSSKCTAWIRSIDCKFTVFSLSLYPQTHNLWTRKVTLSA